MSCCQTSDPSSSHFYDFSGNRTIVYNLPFGICPLVSAMVAAIFSEAFQNNHGANVSHKCMIKLRKHIRKSSLGRVALWRVRSSTTCIIFHLLMFSLQQCFDCSSLTSTSFPKRFVGMPLFCCCV